SIGSIFVSGSLQNSGGAVNVRSSAGRIVQTSSKATISGVDIHLSAETTIGSEASALAVHQVGNGGVFHAQTASGAIHLESTLGDLSVGLISAAAGSADVILSTQGDIVQAAAGEDAAIVGRRITLLSRSGGIGTAE